MAQERERISRDGIPAWSWVVTAAGLLMAVGATAFMIHQAVRGDSSPPRIQVAVDSIMSNGPRHLVQITVKNVGGTPAASLALQGSLEQGDTAVETAAVTIKYVPAGSERRAGLFFSRDPRMFSLKIEPRGYEVP